MPTTAKQLVEAANAVVPKITGAQAQEMAANGAVIVDPTFTSLNFQPACIRMLGLPSSTLQCFAVPFSSGTSISM